MPKSPFSHYDCSAIGRHWPLDWYCHITLSLTKSNWFSSMGAFSVIYNLPLFYQVVLDLSAANAGIRLIPNSIGASLGSLGYGILMARTVDLKVISLISGPLLLAWDERLHLPVRWDWFAGHFQHFNSILGALYLRCTSRYRLRWINNGSPNCFDIISAAGR